MRSESLARPYIHSVTNILCSSSSQFGSRYNQLSGPTPAELTAIQYLTLNVSYSGAM